MKRKTQAKRKVNRNKYIVGNILRIPCGIQEKYTNAVVKLTKEMTNELRNGLVELFKEDYAKEHFGAVGMDAAGVGSQSRILINKAKQKYDQLFGKLAMGLSPWMADSLNASSATQTRLSVSDMPNLKNESGRITIDIKTLDMPTKQILKTSAARSVSFITSIPETHINKVADAVYSSITNGQGLKDLITFLEKQDVSTTNWARNTALDQTRKTYNGLNLGRMKKIGIEKGEWIHSGGSQHPRELHEDYDGQMFDLDKGAPVGDDGGDYVMPGDEPNCRCTFAPVVPIGGDDDDDDTETD